MRVEFVGLPGSGKTHACTAAHSVLRTNGIDARLDRIEEWRPSNGTMLSDYARLAFRRQQGVTLSGSAMWLMRVALGGRGLRPNPAFRACTYLVAVDAHVRALPPAPAWLHDQSTVQAMWSLTMRSGADVTEVTATFAPALLWPDLVVEVRAPLPTIAERLHRRRTLPSSLSAPRQGGLEVLLEAGAAVTDALRRTAEDRSVAWVVLPDEPDIGRQVADRVVRAIV